MARSNRVWGIALAAALAALAATGCRLPSAGKAAKAKLFGLQKVIAFNYIKDGLDPTKLRSVTFTEPTQPKDWQSWRRRGVVTGIGHTWFDLLRNPVPKAVDILCGLDYGGNPKPVVSIDEFGFDFGGQADQKAATILRETRKKRPDLGLAVWEMRGPIPKVLADAYRDAADLVMLECYVGDKRDYWQIITQVEAARLHGILPKTIVALGLGTGGNPGEEWARTPQEVEQQIRFVRLVAPESPGIGFYAAGATPELMAKADDLCARFSDIPTDGRRLPRDVLALHKAFTDPHPKPTLVCSPAWVEPNRSAADPSRLVEPKTLRAYFLNLGERRARNVKVRLRNPPDKGGNVFAEAVVPVLRSRSETIAVLPVTGKWEVWKTWLMEVDAPGCEVMIFKR